MHDWGLDLTLRCSSWKGCDGNSGTGTFLFSTSPKSVTIIDVKSSSDSEKNESVKLKWIPSLHPSEHSLCKNKLWIIQQSDKQQGRFYKRFSIRPKLKWGIFRALNGSHRSLRLLLATVTYEYLNLLQISAVTFFNSVTRKSLQIKKCKCSSFTSKCIT